MAQIAIAIVGVILVSGVFSFWQEHRIERTLAALQLLLPEQAEVIRARLRTVGADRPARGR